MDFDQLLLIFKLVHEESVFRSKKVDFSEIRRNFAVAIQFDQGFAKVIEHNGQVIGASFALLLKNHFGILCVNEMFTYSSRGTNLLVRDLVRWSQSTKAEFIQMSNLTESKRYNRLIERYGLVRTGTNFIGIL